MNIRLLVNGAPAEVDVPGMRRLLDVLREDLGLTGTKEGCGEGECGACSVILDGQLVDACLVPISQVDGSTVRTVEGLARRRAGETDRELDELQRAFLETGGAQCGICTPGMLMAARAYLDAGGSPDEDAIREAIAGNLCRCTGYTKIVEAPFSGAPHGAKGVGELPMDVGAPAVVAAIQDAVGAWVHDLPATPERILAALGAAARPEEPGRPGAGVAFAPPTSAADTEREVRSPIEAGTDPRPDAPTDPLPLRGPQPDGEPEWPSDEPAS